MGEWIWVLIEDVPDDGAVRICGTYYNREDAARWAASRPTRNAFKVMLDGLSGDEVL